MPLGSENFSAFSLEEICKSQNENRAWHKELRLRATALVNNRLAKLISRDEYAANRKADVEDAAECKRRATILVNEITLRYENNNT
jgi:hypothetical protein